MRYFFHARDMDPAGTIAILQLRAALRRFKRLSVPWPRRRWDGRRRRGRAARRPSPYGSVAVLAHNRGPARPRNAAAIPS